MTTVTYSKNQIKMKKALLFFLIISTQTLSAQTFTEVSPAPPLDGIADGSVDFSDVNGDGHKDVLITGRNNVNERIAKLYTNDGSGNFTEMMNTPFEGVRRSSAAFSDVNGDGHEDVLITGEINEAGFLIAKLYTNNGMDNFTEVMNTPFEDVEAGSVTFSDINGDGHHDVLITGLSLFSGAIARLYTNDGTGNFTEVMGTPFEGAVFSSAAFSDVNGDGHNDVLITGRTNFNDRIAKLYTNDGMGNFTEVMNTPFEGVDVGSIAFSDVNNNGHNDVLITGGVIGGSGMIEGNAKLYTNDGMGNFTEVMGTPFEGIFDSSIAFSDVNGDGNDDVLISGMGISMSIAKLYTNDGTGNFTETMSTPFEGVNFSSVAFSDIDGDDKDDVLISGVNNTNQIITKLYINNTVTSSAEELKIDYSLNFTPFPNPPTSTTLYLDYSAAESGELSIKLYSLHGILVSQQSQNIQPGSQTLTIDIAALTSGNYFIQLDNGKARGIARIVVP